MNRRSFLSTAALGAAALALPARASWAAIPDFDHDPIQTLPLRGASLHVLSGMGGNITVLSSPDGLLQIDSGVPARGASVIQADARLSKAPITLLVNTHWHADHVGGNSAAAARGATIVAQDKTYDRMATPQTIDFLKASVPAYPKSARPALTFPDRLTLRHGGETLKLLHVAPAHTDTDAFVHFTQNNVIAAGDLFFNGFYPFIDYSSGGWIGGMVAGIDQMLALTDAQTRIVPGHGAIGTREDLRRSREMLQTVQSRIEPLVAAGRTEAEAVAAKPTKDLDAMWGGFLFDGDTFTTLVYRGLKAHGASEDRKSL